MRVCHCHSGVEVHYSYGDCPLCDAVVRNEQLELELIEAREQAREWEQAAHEWCRSATQDPSAEVVLL